MGSSNNRASNQPLKNESPSENKQVSKTTTPMGSVVQAKLEKDDDQVNSDEQRYLNWNMEPGMKEEEYYEEDSSDASL